MNATSHTPNRLVHEKSPYLQQHAHNPVDWYPWGEEAFTKAREEKKPIFLSIGYSTCHWCHVMERESFENESVATYLNERYVSIKLDREERPDIDAIYMSATQAMTGSGGWPMTVMLTADLKPFFCGTYFPPVPAYGKPSFKQLLERVSELWETKHDELVKSSEGLTDAIKQNAFTGDPKKPSSTIAEAANAYFERTFDSEYGGFGGAPKFPRPVQYDFLFRYYSLTGEERAKEMALFTLDRMALGGLFDQLGGGFHRYSVDKFWLVSHFEKMLYDQAQIVHSYLDAYQITHDEFYANVVRATCDFVLRELTHSDGGFYSALDADSEGEEGTFYIWKYSDFEEILGKEQAEIYAYYSGASEKGNWEEEKNVLFINQSPQDTAKKFQKEEKEVADIITSSNDLLFQARAKRIRPHLDDKILASWNGLMIGAMARAGDILSEGRYISAAKKAADFIWNTLFINTGKALLHRWRDGESRFDATLDSYAFLIKGLLEYAEASLDNSYIAKALTLQNEQDTYLYDTTNGGYFTSRESSDIIVRTKNTYDGAEPSGNSISVMNLLKLYTITGDASFKEKAQKTIYSFAKQLESYPYTMPEMVAGLMAFENPLAEFVFAGDITQPEYAKMRREIANQYIPSKVIFHAESENTMVNEFSKTLIAKGSKLTVYHCHDGACELPITEAGQFKMLLEQIATVYLP